MSHEDLPADWPQRPLTDPDLVRDVLDLCVGHRDRVTGGVAVLALRADRSLAQPVFVSGPIPVPERRTVLTNLLLACTAPETDPAVVVALAHEGRALMDADREVHQVVIEICAEQAITLVSAHLLTPWGVLDLPALHHSG